MLGPKIDARLNLLERKLADLTHRLERLEVSPNDTPAAPVADNAGVDATLTPKPRRGRPPKAKNG